MRALRAVIIPQAPFNIPKYDNGERWDLKAKYTDEGYEDADADVMGASSLERAALRLRV